MKAIRKIDLMHAKFGICEGKKCKDCTNYLRYYVNDRPVRKCKIYGDTRSEATDWTGKNTACGMFGKDWKGRDVVREVTGQHEKKEPEKPMEGQIKLF